MSKILASFAQRVPGIILISLFVFAFVAPIYIPTIYWIVTICLYVFLVSNSFRLAGGTVVAAVQTRRYVETDWHAELERLVAARSSLSSLSGSSSVPDQNQSVTSAAANRIGLDSVAHVIIIPNYKEDFETLCETLDTLAHHSSAQKSYKVILAMEQGEKGCEAKAEKLIALFSHRFFFIRYTVHPSGIPGEARGKSSNVAWASVYYAEHWMQHSNIQNEIFTILDADAQLTQKYFECISCKYLCMSVDEQNRALFAPVLAFDRNSNKVPFMVRIADICWSIGMMANFQIPIRFPCSVYSVSVPLAKSVGYWDAGPEAIGEDLHMSLKCWTHLGMRLNFVSVYIPSSCSDVQADTYWGTVKARFEQSKRHLWGLLDFGYTIHRLITTGCWYKSFFKSFLLSYILFEIFYQPLFGFYHFPGQYIYPNATEGFGALAVDILFYVRLALIPAAIVTGLGFEQYYYVCCKFREGILRSNKIADRNEKRVESGNNNVGDSDSQEALNSIEEAEIAGMVAYRKWYQLLDWAALPFCLFAFYLIPGINAMLWQMYTNRLDYKVSLKPTTTVKIDSLAQENKNSASNLGHNDDNNDNNGTSSSMAANHRDGDSVRTRTDSYKSANNSPSKSDAPITISMNP